MSTVLLRAGDTFDRPADLIVLPCSTAGTVTSFVRDRLARYRLPDPGRMTPGTVTVLPFEGGENIARYVACATSVERYRASPEIVRQIAGRLGEITREIPAAAGCPCRCSAPGPAGSPRGRLSTRSGTDVGRLLTGALR